MTEKVVGLGIVYHAQLGYYDRTQVVRVHVLDVLLGGLDVVPAVGVGLPDADDPRAPGPRRRSGYLDTRTYGYHSERGAHVRDTH